MKLFNNLHPIVQTTLVVVVVLAVLNAFRPTIQKIPVIGQYL